MKERYLEVTQNISLWLIVFACFSVNLPTFFVSVSTISLAVFWLLSRNFKIKFSRIKTNPVAIMAILLFVLYVIGVLYSSAMLSDRIKYLLKYEKLMLIPLIISLMSVSKMRVYALNAFLMSSIIVVFISYLKWLGWISHFDPTGEGFFVFNSRITHGVLIAFAVYMMLNRALQSKGLIRLTWVFLLVLAAIDITFLVNGRTGQIILMALIPWFTFEVWGLKSVKYWIGLVFMAVVLHQAMSINIDSRLLNIQQELNSHQQVKGKHTSAGQRMEMYQTTLALIKKHPFFGGGTGSLSNEYEIEAKQNNFFLDRVANPHNQFLLTSQELGLVGFLVLSFMWLSAWKLSSDIVVTQDGILLRGLILTMVIGCVFNSLLMDAGEGNFFCLLAGVLASSNRKSRL